MKAGTQERGTERGTEVKCGRPLSSLAPYAQGVFIHWTGLDSPKNLFFSVGQKYLFTKVACIGCFHVFPRVGRGQRSRAYLISFSKMLLVVDDRGILFSVFYASPKGWSSMSAVNKCSSNLFIEAH